VILLLPPTQARESRYLLLNLLREGMMMRRNMIIEAHHSAQFYAPVWIETSYTDALVR